MVTIGQFLLGFRLVKRVTVTDRHAGDSEGDKAEELRNHVPQMRLVVDDIAHVERPRLCHHAHQRQTEEHFIAQGLRGCTHRPQQRVFVVTRPAGEQHGVNRQTGHHQEEQDADVQVSDHPRRADRHDSKGQQQRRKGDNRRQSKDYAVRKARNPVLFKEHLDHVGDELQRAAPADTVRSVAVLEQTQQTTFAKAHERAAGHHHQQNHHCLEDA